MNVFIKIVSNANLWASLVAIAGAVAAAFGLPQASIQQITSIISAAAVLIASILGYNIQASAIVKAQAQMEAYKSKQ